MEIRNADLNDVRAISLVEALCFPAAEAASESAIEARVKAFPNHFWLGFEDGELVSFVNGLVTDRRDLADEMFENAALHDEDGDWQMLFSVCTRPGRRGNGHAGEVLKRVIDDCKKSARKGLVLTCKEALIPFYARFGFVNEGPSLSTHGGALWYQMRLTF